MFRMCDQKNGVDLREDDLDELSASDESEAEEQPSSAPFDLELDGDNDDDNDFSAPVVGPRAQSSFSLRGGNSAFSNRSHSIFDCLDSVAQLAGSSLKQDTDTTFARPLPPGPSRKTNQPPPSSPTPAKKRGTPDYLVHPERWTHYSLEDVAETSNQGNRMAAHQYLSSLQQHKEQEESQSGSSCKTQQKMIFSRPSGLRKEHPAGQPSVVKCKEAETRLSHLEEDDESEECKEKQRAVGSAGHAVEDAEGRAKDEKGSAGRAEKKELVQKEKGEEENEEEKIAEARPGFTSFRKTNRKNYRKSSGQGDD